MIHLFKALLEPLTMGLMAVVTVAGVLLIWRMHVLLIRAKFELQALDAEPLTAAFEKSEPTGLARRIQAAVVFRTSVGRLVLRKGPRELLADWADEAVYSQPSYLAGSSPTGVALIFTFFLIAFVLASEVGPAIQSGGSVDMGHLSAAVALMGSKFVVSVLGIVFSLLHQFYAGRYRGALDLEIERIALSPVFASVVTLDAFDAESTAQSVAALRAARDDAARHHAEAGAALLAAREETARHHAESVAGLAEVHSALTNLRSIDVSIKNIGTEVAVSLQNAVSNQIVGRIEQALHDVVDEIHTKLSGTFAIVIEAELSKVGQSLTAIEKAIAGQAQGEVEKLLSKLSDAVSGGFASESSRMREALEGFGTVVPRLERQLQQLSATAGEDLSRRSEDSARQSQEVLAQMALLIGRLEQQQQSSMDAAHAATESFTRIQHESANESAQVQAKLLRELSNDSRAAVESFLTGVRGAAGETADQYSHLARELQEAASALSTSRSSVEDSTRALADARSSAESVLREVQSALANVREVSNGMSSATSLARGVAERNATMVTQCAEVLAGQERFARELGQLWPMLFDQYLSKFDSAAKSMGQAWNQQSDTIQRAVTGISQNFSSSAQDFGTGVAELAEQVEALRAELGKLSVTAGAPGIAR